VSVVYILEVAVGIGLLILVHELGHFIAAKLSNVKVEKFSIGFGPELVGVTRGETRYSLRIMPLGGYVRMLGDEPGSDTAVDPRSFLAQGFGKKVAIILAGSVSNILLALVLFIAVFQIGIKVDAAKIGAVEYGLPAYYAGMEVGDEVVAIEGRKYVDFSDLYVKSALTDPGSALHLVIKRGGNEMRLVVYPEYVAGQGMSFIGVERYPTLEIGALVTASAAEDESPSDGARSQEAANADVNPVEEAGVAPGWTIAAVNGARLTDWFEFKRFVVANGLEPFELTVAKSGEEKTVTVTPQRIPAPLLGITAFQTTEIEKVTEGSRAAAMGLAAGDVITAVGSRECKSVFDVSYAVTAQLSKLPPLKVVRGGETLEIPWDVRPSSGVDFIAGITTKALPQAAWVAPGSPAEMMGIRPGDDITAVDGKPTNTFEDIRTFLKEAQSDEIGVEWTRAGEAFHGAFQPAFVGVLPGVDTVERRFGLAESCRVGLRKAWDFASQIYILIRKAFTGQAAIGRNLSGPVGIARVSYKYAVQGVSHLLFFLAIIGINLGVVNLLPIPILDGGLLATFLVEKIKGSPISLTVQAILQYAGLAIIIALFVFMTWQDIARIVHGM